MLRLIARFLPGLPSLATVKWVLIVVVLIAAFSAGVMVTKWYYKSGEMRAYREQVERFRDQANIDRAKQAELNRKLAEIDHEATKWRRKWKEAQRDPVTQAWSDTPHPPAVGLMLNSTVDLSSDSNPRP